MNFASLLPLSRSTSARARENCAASKVRFSFAPRIAIAAILLVLLALFGHVQRGAAQIQVVPNAEGKGSGTSCSLQEATYSTEFGDNVAIHATTPHYVHHTACKLGGASGTSASLRVQQVLSAMPLLFEPNVGQDDAEVKYLSRGKGYSLHLGSSQAVFLFLRHESGNPGSQRGGLHSHSTLSASMLRMSLVGSNPAARSEALQPALAKTFYYVGNDRSKWRTNIPNYARVKYTNVYQGIDLAYYGNQGQLEYDFIVNPKASAGSIRLAVDDGWKTSVGADGGLLLSSKSGEVRWRTPVAYQEIDGTRKLVEARFVPSSEHGFGFAVGDYDHTRALIIDPVIVYSTYLGGSSGMSSATGVALDKSGNAWLVGSTSNSATFPAGQSSMSSGALGGEDAYIAEVNPNASGASSLLMTIVFGGSSNEDGNGIALDSAGNVYIAGDTFSADLPLQNPLDCPVFSVDYCGALVGTQAAFVAQFDTSGNLLFSTYLSSADKSSANAIAVAGSAIYVAGSEEPLLPTTASAYQSSCVLAKSFETCAFVSKIDPVTPTLLYSTALGPPLNSDNTADAFAIAADASGHAYLAGTAADAFPLVGAYQAFSGGLDAFVSVLDTTQSANASLLYSTYFGGSGGDFANAVAVDSSGRIFVGGRTASNDLPITGNAVVSSFPGGNSAGFIAELDPTQAAPAQLLYSTYLAGSAFVSGPVSVTDAVNAIALQNGLIYVAGETESTDFPTKNAIAGSLTGLKDAFVAEIDPNVAKGLVFSTYLGGKGEDVGLGLALDPQGNMFVAGFTQSTVFPTTLGGFQRSLSGGQDAFLMKISDPRSDLSVTKTAGAATASAGSTITYTITLTNNGPADASSASMSDPLPAGTTFNALTITGPNAASWSCSNPATGANGTVSCTKSVAVTNGESDTFILVANVAQNILNNASITNTATVASSATDLKPGNNSASVTVTATNLADLLLSKKANLTSVKAGSSLIYTVTVKNLGPNVAAATMVTDPIPSNSAFASLSNGAPCTAPPVGTVGTVTCNFGNLASGTSASVQITVKVSGSTNKSSLTNTATASTSTFDPNTINNAAAVTTQIYGNKK